ncbi:MAG: lamin tail domain-containing protein [Polyangiales bacterium]
MVHVRTWARGLACLVLVLDGCGRQAILTEAACDDLGPGDLVITEILANPDGTDGSGEYIELFNAREHLIALDGLTLSASRSDGTGAETHRMAGTSMEPGEYFVVGNAPVDATPAYLDYSYEGALGSLRNSDGSVAIRCGEVLIDRVTYERTVDGRALELDGRLAPDDELNDEAGHWCETPQGVREISPGNLGTPGAVNSPCEAVRFEGLCREGGSSRALIKPEPSDLRITEWMANPEGADTDLEWVELLFMSEADLNGLQLGPAPDALRVVIEGDECFPVAAGSRVVFGASPTAAPRVGGELGFSLGNTGPRRIVVGIDGVILHEVSYTGTVEGVAWQLDPGEILCLAPLENEYAAANFGTPGEANPPCVPVLGPGMCYDGGSPRPIVSPVAGAARITEWMANPSSVGNRQGEWVEVRFETAADLNGLVLSDLTSSATVLDVEECLRVPAGTYAVFARRTNPSENGGIEGVYAELSLSLNNSDETITLSVDGQTLDSVTYARSTAGVATQIDDAGQICDAAYVYGDGDLGTPGSANPRCS